MAQKKQDGVPEGMKAVYPGKRGEYPAEIETYKTTPQGLRILLRPVKLTDEPLLKEFFDSLSDESLYKRFISARRDMPHERLEEFIVIDYTQAMVILAVITYNGNERVIGVAQYGMDENHLTAEVAIVVLDEYQHHGIGTELLSYVTYLARKQGLLGFTAEVLVDNLTMLKLFEEMGFDIQKRPSEGVYDMKLMFKEEKKT